MKSRNTSNQNNTGFTLTEILIVIGIIAVVTSASLAFSMDDWRSYTFRGDRDLLIAALYKARSQAINNMCFGSTCTNGKAHGVHLQSGGYLVFQGASYAARDTAVDEVIPMTGSTQTSGADIVFAALSGNATPAGTTLTVTDTGSNTSVITISGEGQIVWTH
jgi:prepilin-type N-terminal cleavage/methylation domain-containing protein